MSGSESTPPEPHSHDLLSDYRRRLSRPHSWVMIGVVIGFTIGLIAVASLTQTRWGRSQILEFTVTAIGGSMNGVLTIERLEGNLISGARIYGLNLSDHAGSPLAIVDSAHIQYRVASFVGGDMIINRLVAWNARIDIFRMPGDSLWNYQAILQSPDTLTDPAAEAGATLIEELVLHGGSVSIRAPLEPDSRLPLEQQRIAIEEILADTARWMIQQVPDGYLRVMLVDVTEAAVSELFIGPDERGGIYLEVEHADSDIRMWRDPPLELDSVRAALHLQEGIVNFEAPMFVLPDSHGGAVGRLDLRGERMLYDVVFTAPRVALSDLRWLYPWLPADPAAGHGSGRVWLEDRPDDLLFLAKDLLLEMPGTRITGEFGVISDGQRLRFVDVDLDVDPVDIESVEKLLPEGIPIEGLEIGGAVVEGTGGQ